MPVKRNKAGKLQNYDPSTGRYSRMSIEEKQKYLLKSFMAREAIVEDKRDRRRRYLAQQARSSKDPKINVVYEALESAVPYCVQAVNQHVFDKNLNRYREMDIITRHTIVEVKTGSAQKKSKQLLGQKQYAKEHNKAHIVFAPDISKATKREYNRMGLNITTSLQELVNMFRRYER